MLAFTAKRRWRLSFARTLSQRLRTRSTYSTASTSQVADSDDSSRNTSSRVIRVFGLPLNYDVSTVVRAVVGFEPLERVRPHADHIVLTCYSWRQALRFSGKKGIRLDDRELRVAWMDSHHDDENDFEPISAGAVARLGYRRASRFISIHGNDIEESMLKKAGKFESMVPFVTKGNARGFVLTFFNEKACSQFYVKCTRGKMQGLPFDNVEFFAPASRMKEISRCVLIRWLQPEVATSPYLREHVESLSSSLFRAHTGRFGGDRITALHQKPHLVTIKFCAEIDAQLFLDKFPAATFRAQMMFMKAKALHYYLRIAIQSGAGRALTMSLPRPMSLSVTGLTRDFSQFDGLVDVTMSTDHEVILRYNTVLAALKTVCALETGTHHLPNKYTGAQVSFLPRPGSPPTRPITIVPNHEQSKQNQEVLRLMDALSGKHKPPTLIPGEPFQDIIPETDPLKPSDDPSP